MHTLWSAGASAGASAAAALCFLGFLGFLGLAGCEHAQENHAQTAADRWFRVVTSEPGPEGKYKMMCKSYRQGVPIETFAEALAHNAYLNGATGLQILDWEHDWARAVRGVLWTNTGSYDVEIYEGLENGRMCITGLSIAGAPVLSLPAEGAAGSASTSAESVGVSAR
jgi:hypothetical protein